MTALLAITADEIEDYINRGIPVKKGMRSEEHTSELQSHSDLVCRLLLEKKKKDNYYSSSVLNTGLMKCVLKATLFDRVLGCDRYRTALMMFAEDTGSH